MTPALAPRILLVIPAQWSRALLRAELREAGYDAVGTRSIAMARRLAAPAPDRGPVRLVVIDQDALAGEDPTAPHLLARKTSAPIVLLAPAVRRPAEGPWAEVLRRPVAVGDLVREIARLVPLLPENRPLD